jgi:hypothetical protein
MLSLRGVRLGSARLMQLLGRLGVRLGSQTTYAAPGVLRSKSQYDSRTQTEGLSPYWYRLNSTKGVTDLQGPPLERTPEEKLWDLKTRAQQYARDRGSCDDTRISYLEFLESEAEDDLTLARMIAG